MVIDKANGLVGIISDAHGNGPAFDRAIILLKDFGVESFIYLGDAIGYIPSLSVLSSILKLGVHIKCIKGNHEKILLTGEYDSDEDTVYQLSRVNAVVSSENVEMISAWKEQIRVRYASKSVLFVHGSPADITTGYVYPDSDLSVFQSDVDVVFMGHTHRPFIRDYNGVRYVNVGSCGLPRDDGRYGSAAIFNPNSGHVRVIRFDITNETETALRNQTNIHASVYGLFERREKAVFGELVW